MDMIRWRIREGSMMGDDLLDRYYFVGRYRGYRVSVHSRVIAIGFERRWKYNVFRKRWFNLFGRNVYIPCLTGVGYFDTRKFAERHCMDAIDHIMKG